MPLPSWSSGWCSWRWSATPNVTVLERQRTNASVQFATNVIVRQDRMDTVLYCAHRHGLAVWTCPILGNPDRFSMLAARWPIRAHVDQLGS